MVLGNVRDRMREPIEESGVRLIWEVGELPTVTPKAILAIPRRKRACGRPRCLDEGPAARAVQPPGGADGRSERVGGFPEGAAARGARSKVRPRRGST